MVVTMQPCIVCGWEQLCILEVKSVKIDSSSLQIFPLVTTYALLCVSRLNPPPPLFWGLCVKLLGGPLIHGFNRPQSICVSYSNRGLTLNKCVTDSCREQQDPFVLIEGHDFTFP